MADPINETNAPTTEELVEESLGLEKVFHKKRICCPPEELRALLIQAIPLQKQIAKIASSL